MKLLKIKPGIPYELDADDNPTFEEWMQRIDRVVTRAVGLSIHDLPDCTFRDWYEERMRPVWAADAALRRAADLDEDEDEEDAAW